MTLPLIPQALRRFYAYGFEESEAIKRWSKLWQKQIKLNLADGAFVNLNQFRQRFSYKSLKKYSVRFAPAHLYMSVLNWLMPERVAEKGKANLAYPIGGEYMVDVDYYLNYIPHNHRNVEEGCCEGCLENSKELSLRLLDAMEDNYTKLEVVFSGRRGFHLHVLDFDVSDWAHYNERNPIKSHEVARLLYTKHLRQVCGGFDNDHFKLSVDPMRVVTFPDSINGETGLVCASLGGLESFERLSIQDILHKARRAKIFNYPIVWKSLTLDSLIRDYNQLEARYYAHPEPKRRL